MRFDECWEGRAVIDPDFPDTHGEIVDLDEVENVVYVSFPGPGTDIIDMDPADLEPAP